MKKLFLVAFFFVLFSFSVFGQCQKLNTIDFHKQIRLLPPATIEKVETSAIYYRIPQKFILSAEPSVIETDSFTIFPKSFLKDFKSGLWRIIYCEDTGKAVIVFKLEDADRGDFETGAEQIARAKKKKE